MHQKRPKKIADRTIRGHQSLQTKLVVRLVLLSWLRKNRSLVGEENPIITNPIKTINVSILKETGNHLYSRSLLIDFNINGKIPFASYSAFNNRGRYRFLRYRSPVD
jgi:hypothetical protein